ncbi:TetR family transcriptional regulator [Paracidovorax anthurii]|uniref:TetR family transcriptional regulator n=1 Tax=Paracidovorax anthurii TaxID=78229 RepID=A0A328YV99_9BURK|nr:hypothetical protein AX018_103538 [Paracidovorax anthurii]
MFRNQVRARIDRQMQPTPAERQLLDTMATVFALHGSNALSITE